MPQIVAVAGPNGSGKSTMARALVQEAFGVMEFVNADDIARGLSAFNSESVALQSGRIMLARLRILAQQGVDFAYETTMSGRAGARWLSDLASKGYSCHIVFLWLSSAELAVARVAERVRRGGHSLSEELVRRRFTRSIRNFFELYQPLASSWLLYDNSSEAGPSLIASGRQRQVTTVRDPELWQAIHGGYCCGRNGEGSP